MLRGDRESNHYGVDLDSYLRGIVVNGIWLEG